MKMKLATIAAATMLPLAASAQAGAGAIINGVPWYDDRDSVVSAHGANIVADGGRYYMFGENKTDSANTFTGFSCYSSANLVNWKFERIALKTQAGGRLGPGSVGERPKVMRCPQTGEYVMLMHSDDLRYKDPCVAYATSDSINGEYTFRGPLLYKGKPIRKWDIGAFVDDDGQAYLLVHHGYIYRLAPDFHSADSCLTAGVKGAGESPAMFKHDGTYYWLSSHTTSWERNDNMYHTSKSLSGPWQMQGPFCPEGSLTHNSQTTYVLPLTIEGRQVPMFMGDRWSFPKQHSAATYVWMPITMENGRMSIPELWQAWDPQTGRQADIGMRPVGRRWASDAVGDTMSVAFSGCRVGLKGTLGPDCGYALVRVTDGQGRTVQSQTVDFYAKKASTGLRFVSRRLPEGRYTLTVTVTGFKPNWTDKSKTVYGSRGTFVRIDDVVVMD